MFKKRSDERDRLDVTNADGALSTGTTAGAAVRSARDERPLRFATVRVNQFRSRPRRESDVRPILRRVAGLERRTDHAGRDKLVETTWTAALGGRSRRNQLRDDPAVCGDRDALPGFASADVPTEIVLQLTNAS